MIYKIGFTGLLVVMVCGMLCGCTENKPEVPLQEIRLVVTEDTLSGLENPKTNNLILDGSTCYEAIADYRARHPEVAVHYTVCLGKRWIPSDTQVLILREGDYRYDLLAQNLRFLPELKELILPDTALNREQLLTLRNSNQGLKLDYWVELLGKRYYAGTEKLNLGFLSGKDVEEAIQKLPSLLNLTQVELMGADGTSQLEPEHVYRLQCAVPEAAFHYCFDLFGTWVSTADETVELVNRQVEGDYDARIRQALDILPNCRSIRLDNCGVENAIMAEIREDYRNRTKVVWRVFFAKRGSCMTDRKIIRYVYNLDNSNCAALAYCEDAEYVDVGHNEYLSDCSWVSGMPRLKAIILSGSLIDDLSGFENCNDLEFLELAYCSKVKDLSALRNCRKLQMVNTSFTGVTDLSPLDGAAMERLCSVSTAIPEQEQQRFRQQHPECLTLFRGKQPYGYCWRYEKDGYTPTEYYARLKEVFHYPDTTDTTW